MLKIAGQTGWYKQTSHSKNTSPTRQQGAAAPPAHREGIGFRPIGSGRETLPYSAHRKGMGRKPSLPPLVSPPSERRAS